LAVCGCLITTFTAPRAAAQTDEDRAGARAVATQAFEAEEAGKCDEAVALFRRAEAIVHAPPHLLHIARCEVKLGRLVSAREDYLKVMREELPSTAPRAFVDAQGVAQQELAALESRIPTLKVLVEGGEGDEQSERIVLLDGAPMPLAFVGVERPIDPGRHELRAREDGYASEPVVVTIAEGAHVSAQLVLRPSGPKKARTTTHPGSGDRNASGDGGPETPAEQRGGSKVGAFVGWGVGAAGLIFGTTMMLVNRDKRADADALCPAGNCPVSRKPEVESLDSDAGSAATLSWIGYGVGVAGLGVGTVLYFMAEKSKAPGGESAQARAAVIPWVGVGGAGLRGRF